MNMPKAITEAAVRDAKSRVGMTAATLANGDPNPAYAAAVAELEQLAEQRAAWVAFTKWVAETLGYTKRNDYPIKAGGTTYAPLTVFVKKHDGKTTFLPVDDAWRKFCATNKVE